MSVPAPEPEHDPAHDWAPGPLGFLSDELAALDAAHQRRHLRPVDAVGPVVDRGGRQLLNFASNDYLGLSTHPHLKRAALDAIAQHGVGAGASRLVSGHLPPHAELEARFAAFKHAQAALLLPTGYMANLAVLCTLPGPGDLICLDKLCHASLIDAARFATLQGAQLRIFPHLNHAKLERLLAAGGEARSAKSEERGARSEERRARSEERGARSQAFEGLDVRSSPRALRSSPRAPRAWAAAPRRFIVTDSIFSMDGDAADLPALCDLAQRYDAILIVDEAHATGVLGDSGAGLAEAQGVADRIHLTVSTASKALGGLGGIITGPRLAIDTLVNRARPFIYTTAVPPAQAATIAAALDVIHAEPQRRTRVLELARRLRAAVASIAHFRGGTIPNPESRIQNDQASARHGPARWEISPIVPVIVGSSEAALHLSAHLESRGILGAAIRPPTVAPGSARVRLSVRADHTDAHLDALIAALRDWRPVAGT
jgi:8-amino-7-oxononanoate synthase